MASPSRFSGRLSRRKTNKTDNSPAAIADKIDLRRRVLDAVTGPVFDAYAGDGQMYKAIWSHAPQYVGCDEKWFRDQRKMYACDCRRLMRNIDLQPFTIFDFDSYGSPWEALYIFAHRRSVAPLERIGLAITEGSGLRLKFNGLPAALALLAGFGTLRVPGAIRSQADIAQRAIRGLAEIMGCRIDRLWRAGKAQGSARLYYGVVLVGQ